MGGGTWRLWLKLGVPAGLAIYLVVFLTTSYRENLSQERNLTIEFTKTQQGLTKALDTVGDRLKTHEAENEKDRVDARSDRELMLEYMRIRCVNDADDVVKVRRCMGVGEAAKTRRGSTW